MGSNIDDTEALRLWFSNNFGLLNEIYKDNWVNESGTDMELVNKVNEIIYRNRVYAKLFDNFSEEVVNLRKRMHLTSRFERVIAHSILCNLVQEKDYWITYAKRMYAEGKQKYTGVFDGFDMFISPEATKKDIIEAYERDIKPIQGPHYGIDATVPSSTKQSIFEDRERYWKRESGLGPSLISASEQKGFGIRKYKEAKKFIHEIPTTAKEKEEFDKKDIALENVKRYVPAIKKSVYRYKEMLSKVY
jgi:hypothetical protein